MVEDAEARLQRFLRPRHAAQECAIIQWHGKGEADTPAEDAVCRLYLACEDGKIATAAFAVFGPPVVVACADWACEWLTQRTIDAARGLTVQEFERALVLAPSERYAALLALDALASALADLGSCSYE